MNNYLFSIVIIVTTIPAMFATAVNKMFTTLPFVVYVFLRYRNTGDIVTVGRRTNRVIGHAVFFTT